MTELWELGYRTLSVALFVPGNQLFSRLKAGHLYLLTRFTWNTIIDNFPWGQIKAHCEGLRIIEIPNHYRGASKGVNGRARGDGFRNLRRLYRSRVRVSAGAPQDAEAN